MKVSQTTSAILFMGVTLITIGCVTEVQGEAFDPVRECWGGTKTFDYSGGSGCDDGEAFGRDVNGGIWKFRNGCIGDDLERTNFSDDDYPDCPPSDVGFEETLGRDVNIDQMCLEAWEPHGRVAEDEPCVLQGPELKRYSDDFIVLFSNHCNTAATDPYTDHTAEEVMMWPECSD